MTSPRIGGNAARPEPILPELGEPQHRDAYAAGQHVEGDEFTDSQVSLDDELGAEEQDGNGDQLVHELDGLARHVAETEDAKAGRHIGGELLVPATLHLRLDSHGLQRLDAGDAFDEESLVLGPALKFFVEASTEKRRRTRRDPDIEGKGAQNDQSQPGRVDDHHAQENDGEHQIDDQGQGRAREEIADILELTHTSDRIPCTPRLKIGERQRHQVAKQACTQLDVDAVGRMGEQVGP